MSHEKEEWKNYDQREFKKENNQTRRKRLLVWKKNFHGKQRLRKFNKKKEVNLEKLSKKYASKIKNEYKKVEQRHKILRILIQINFAKKVVIFLIVRNLLIFLWIMKN